MITPPVPLALHLLVRAHPVQNDQIKTSVWTLCVGDFLRRYLRDLAPTARAPPKHRDRKVSNPHCALRRAALA